MSRKSWTWVLAGALVVIAVGVLIWQWPRPTSGAGPAAPPATPTAGGTASPPRAQSPSPGATSAPAPAPVSPKPAGPSYLPDPATRMLLGTYTSLSGQGTEAAVEQREAALGRRYDLQVTYYNWDDVFPDAGERTIVAHGRTVVMTWYGPGKDPSDHRTLAEINAGADDAMIRQQAEAIKAFGHRVYLRLMPEMNGFWYRGFSGDPSAYVAAWRRVHRLFAAAGVTNVTWVWCPSASRGEADAYYPGDAYTDIIGVDGFSNVKYGYQTFQRVFGRFLAHWAGRKPLMIVETATNSGAGDAAANVGSAASFIDGMHSYLKNTAGPRYGVVAVCWFDTNDTDSHDWRVDQTPGSWRAWLSLGRDPYFGGHG